MYSPQKTIRLFPLSHPYIAARTEVRTLSSQESLQQNNNSSYHCFVPSHQTDHSKLNKTLDHFIKTKPFILHSGYYFYHQKSTTRGDSLGHDLYLGNILTNHFNSLAIHEVLDPSLVAMVRDSPKKYLIVGVNEHHNEIFLYALKPILADYHFSTNTMSPPLSLNSYAMTNFGEKTPLHSFGLSIYKTRDKKIVSISGFSKIQESYLAVAFSSGEVMLGIIRNATLNILYTFTPPTTQSNVEILSSPTGMLVAHFPLELKFRIWNFNEGYHYTEKRCPEIYNLTISSDGTYLTALAVQKDNLSDTVHCYRLAPIKHFTFKLDKPIVDFVIGYQNHISILKNHQKLDPEFPGTIDQFIFKSSKREKIFSFFHHHKEKSTYTSTLKKPIGYRVI